MTVDVLLTRYGVDTSHARHVADLALTLFDGSKQVHGLSKRARHLLEVGALLHTVGMTIDESDHHIIGRDIVLDTAVAELDEDERAVVACLVAFHRKKVYAEHEPAFLRLRKKDRAMVLRLAALLRIADGLDYSRTQTTRIQSCKVKNGNLHLILQGIHSAEDATRALKKSDLWAKVLESQFNITPEALPTDDQQPAPAPESSPEQPEAFVNGDHHAAEPVPEEEQPERPGPALRPSDDILSELGRRLLRSNFQRLLSQERGAREDKDIEYVHQMRVATRRLRAILQIISEVAPEKQVRYFRKELQYVARALSPVRDCDVFLEQVGNYCATLPEEERSGMKVLNDALQRDRVEARYNMLSFFESERYRQFRHDFAVFMTDDAREWDTTLRVRDLAGSIIWRRYEALRAHEVECNANGGIQRLGEEPLHMIRISGKRLRYVLEVFEGAFGSGTERALKPLKDVQEHLGGLQDIAVATEYLTHLQGDDESRAAIQAYQNSREAERTRMLEELPERWDNLLSETYRRTITELMLGL